MLLKIVLGMFMALCCLVSQAFSVSPQWMDANERDIWFVRCRIFNSDSHCRKSMNKLYDQHKREASHNPPPLHKMEIPRGFGLFRGPKKNIMRSKRVRNPPFPDDHQKNDVLYQ